MPITNTLTIDTRVARQMADTEQKSAWLYQLLTWGFNTAAMSARDLSVATMFLDRLTLWGYRIEKSSIYDSAAKRITDYRPMPGHLAKALRDRALNPRTHPMETEARRQSYWNVAKWAQTADPEATTVAARLLVECATVPYAQLLATAEVVSW